MRWPDRYRRIVLTGPESTGKTTLARALAGLSGGLYVPEYARTYVASLNRTYTREDLEYIARIQVTQYGEAITSGKRPIVFDTFLIITKIWFVTVYGSAPAWLDRAISECAIDIYLLCFPDIPWKADPVRENSGKRRRELYQAYKTELERAGLPYQIIKGKGEKRIADCQALLKDKD